MKRFRWQPSLPLALSLVACATAVAMAGASPAPNIVRQSPPYQPAPQATVAPGYITVRGQILYIDRFSDRNHPVAGTKLEIWDLDTRGFSGGEKLAETRTDAAGFYQSLQPIRNVDQDGPVAGQTEGTQDVYVKLFSDNGDVRLFRPNTTQEYSWLSYKLDPTDGIRRNVPDGEVIMPTLYIQENADEVEALWTFVNLSEGWLYMKEQTNRDPGKVLAYWGKDSTDGPRYDPTTKAIYFRSGDAGYGSTVVQQEAYALMDNALGTLPGAWSGKTAGPQSGIQQAGDAATALLHGFATFYPLAVYKDPVFLSTGFGRLDLDLPGPNTQGWAQGDTVPGRVAGAFWDLQQADLSEDGTDKYNATFVDIWDVFRDKQPTTFKEWWDGWKALGKNTCDAVGSLEQNSIKYNNPPQVAAVPDITLDEDTTATANLTSYVTDIECPSTKLSFTMVSAGDPHAGVKLLENTDVISVTPDTNWFGQTGVQMQVTDGTTAVSFSFRVIVRSVNDCPLVKPRIPKPPSALHGTPITINLLPYGEDVEDPPQQLVWRALLELQNQPDITVDGQGTSMLTFRLKDTIIADYNALVTLFVKDRDGCEGSQQVILSWTSRPNKAPFIYAERFTSEYFYPKNVAARIDLTGVANDDEDGPDALQWYAVNSTLDKCQMQWEDAKKQVLIFTPFDNFEGADVIDLEVQDTQGLVATGTITITWKGDTVYGNTAPQILRNKLLGRTVGMDPTTGAGAAACYPLVDKAFDPDQRSETLRWFITGHDPMDLTVEGQGTTQLCLRSARASYEGCIPATFTVVDEWGANDKHEVRTCWRTIKIFLPRTVKNR